MKFLCVGCNEAMKLQTASGPQEGSMTIEFICPVCGADVALLTNPGETQLVQALDVQIGGRNNVRAEPLAFVRRNLAGDRQNISTPGARAEAAEGGLTWTADAEQRLQNIPEMVREMARTAIERFARAAGQNTITPAIMDRAREEYGM